VGEPLRGTLTTGELTRLLAERGFSVRQDDCNEDWAARYGGSSALAFVLRAERLMVALRPR